MYIRQNNYSINSDYHNINKQSRNKPALSRFRLTKLNTKSFPGNSISFYDKLPHDIISKVYF